MNPVIHLSTTETPFLILVIAKRVIDSVTPGIAQFGSIWLPMTHIMLVPFVANNFLFQTGLAVLLLAECQLPSLQCFFLG